MKYNQHSTIKPQDLNKIKIRTVSPVLMETRQLGKIISIRAMKYIKQFFVVKIHICDLL